MVLGHESLITCSANRVDQLEPTQKVTGTGVLLTLCLFLLGFKSQFLMVNAMAETYS
jgi:hypothetical protein